MSSLRILRIEKWKYDFSINEKFKILRLIWCFLQILALQSKRSVAKHELFLHSFPWKRNILVALHIQLLPQTQYQLETCWKKWLNFKTPLPLICSPILSLQGCDNTKAMDTTVEAAWQKDDTMPTVNAIFIVLSYRQDLWPQPASVCFQISQCGVVKTSPQYHWL